MRTCSPARSAATFAISEVDELLERGLGRIPAEALACAGRITEQIHHIGGTIEIGGHFNDNTACCSVYAFLIAALAFEAQFDAGTAEGQDAEFAYGCCSPVAITKSSGLGCCKISHMHST